MLNLLLLALKSIEISFLHHNCHYTSFFFFSDACTLYVSVFLFRFIHTCLSLCHHYHFQKTKEYKYYKINTAYTRTHIHI